MKEDKPKNSKRKRGFFLLSCLFFLLFLYDLFLLANETSPDAFYATSTLCFLWMGGSLFLALFLSKRKRQASRSQNLVHHV